MDYYKFNFRTGVSDNEVLIALLSVFPFDTFVEHESGFEGYIPENLFDNSIEADIEVLTLNHQVAFTKEFIKSENWNETWESNFHPIIVDDFCGIRAEFHSNLVGVEHELVITPKMAFGTGHHETTFMVIQLMRGINFNGQSILDYGCGTGVLAILASKMGGAKIDAIDIEQAAWQNTIENCETNGIENVNSYKGELSILKDRTYGIVLANINRNVILESLETLSDILIPSGLFVISGILKTDHDLVFEAVKKNGFEHLKTIEKNKWLAMQWKRK